MQRLEIRGFQTGPHRFLQSTVTFSLSTHFLSLSLLALFYTSTLFAHYTFSFRHIRDSLFSSSKLDFEPPTLPESDFHFRPRHYFQILDIIPVIVGIIARIEPAS